MVSRHADDNSSVYDASFIDDEAIESDDGESEPGPETLVQDLFEDDLNPLKEEEEEALSKKQASRKIQDASKNKALSERSANRVHLLP